MQQNNGMSRAAAMAYRVLIRRGVSALPVHPLEILSACRNTVVWADVTAAEQLKIPREVLLRQLANAEAITFRQTIQEETHFIVVYREGGNPARLRFTLAHELGHRLLHRGDEPNMEREADCFASHLLCPRPTLGRLCARENTFSVEQAAVLAYVSASALQRLSRVEELVVSPEILSAATWAFPCCTAARWRRSWRSVRMTSSAALTASIRLCRAETCSVESCAS